MSGTSQRTTPNESTTELKRVVRTPSVLLHAPQASLDHDDRICLSEGTRPATMGDWSGSRYVGRARVPSSPWRPPTPHESALLWSTDAPATHCGVGIVRLVGPQLLILLAEKRDALARLSEEESVRHPLVRLVLDAVATAGIAVRHVYSARIGYDQPGLITMTRAVDQEGRIGLHFDRWDGLGVEELASASNRVSVNLGPSDRYFVFLNHTAAEMVSILECANAAPASRDVRDIGLSFMAAFPQYPVVRLRLRPGEAYIAPTENILHDGTSTEVTAANSYLSMRGRFDFSKQ
jgi:hypothetical protein